MRPKFYLLFLLAVNSFAVRAQVVATFAGTGAVGYSGDGDVAAHATFRNCTGVAFDGAGNVYIADRDNNVVRKVNTLGVITTLAGNGMAGYSGDGGAATAAKLNGPANVAVDVAGNVFIADFGNNVVRKIENGRINTYAGTGTAGYTGDEDSANAAQLFHPQGLAIDEAGSLYIADAGNHAVRMVDAGHVMHTIAGTGTVGSSGDGGLAEEARLGTPVSVALDIVGNIYIADFYSSMVRKVDAATGIISRVAGIGVAGYGGDGGVATGARLQFPAGVSVDGAGNLYIADQGNNRIRKVDNAGIITTFAGSVTGGYDGDGGSATAAQLNAPQSVAADGWGRVYIADYGNNVIRLVAMPTAVNTTVAADNALHVYPNPSAGTFTVELPGPANNATITIIDMAGRVIDTKNIAAQAAVTFGLSNIPAGYYVVKAVAGEKVYTNMVSIAK